MQSKLQPAAAEQAIWYESKKVYSRLHCPRRSKSVRQWIFIRCHTDQGRRGSSKTRGWVGPGRAELQRLSSEVYCWSDNMVWPMALRCFHTLVVIGCMWDVKVSFLLLISRKNAFDDVTTACNSWSCYHDCNRLQVWSLRGANSFSYFVGNNKSKTVLQDN